MSTPRPELDAIQRRFRFQKLRQRLLVLAALAWFLTSLILAGVGADENSNGILQLLFIVSANLPSMLLMSHHWRCPSCNRKLRYFSDNAICRNCGARLEHPGYHATTSSRKRR